MIFSLSDTILGEHACRSNFKSKIQLSYTDEKNKCQNHDLIISRNSYYKDVPEEYYLQGTKDEGLYFFWIFILNKYHSYYVGCGNLTSRIRKGYQKFYDDVSKCSGLHLSFLKTNHLSKKEIKKLETAYIKDLCPIMNKVNSNVSSKTYIENIAAYGKMMEYKDLEYIKRQEEMRKIF